MMGYLANDPELKTTVNDHKLTKFKLATNRDWVNSDGERQEYADFHKVVAWGKLAEICGKHIKKGDPIYLEGRISNQKFKDNGGNDRQITEIVADEVTFISIKKNKDQNEVNLVEVDE